MQKQEHEAVEGIKREHRHPRTIGFEPVQVTKAAGARRFRVTPGRLAAAVDKALAARALNAERLEFEGPVGTVADAVDREIGRRRRAGAARKGGGSTAPVDVERMWRGGDDGTTLRKSASEPAVAGPDGEALALVKAAHVAGGIIEATGERRRDLAKRAVAAGSRRPAQALADAYDRADFLQLAKEAGSEISPARLEDAEQMASALGEMPVPRAAFTAPPGWTDDARFVAAEAGATELQAAAVEAAHGSTAWLDRLNMTALAKDFARNRRRMPLSEPPRVKS